MFLCTITFLSFGTYTVLGNLKSKVEISITDTPDDNQEETSEASKELIESFLVENHFLLNSDITVFDSKTFPLTSTSFHSFGLEPSTPPPDLA